MTIDGELHQPKKMASLTCSSMKNLPWTKSSKGEKGGAGFSGK
jgi:hypothetical protein